MVPADDPGAMGTRGLRKKILFSSILRRFSSDFAVGDSNRRNDGARKDLSLVGSEYSSSNAPQFVRVVGGFFQFR